VNDAAMLLLYAAIVALVLVRQFVRRTVSARAFIWVAVLVGYGALGTAATSAGPVAPRVAVLALELLISVAFGLARGRTMRVWRDAAGTAWRQGNVPTLLLWLATILSRLALAALAELALHVPFNPGSVLLGFGVTLAAQQVVVMNRARALPATPATATGLPRTTGDRTGR
jgi:hypothetical protein